MARPVLEPCAHASLVPSADEDESDKESRSGAAARGACLTLD